MSRRGLVVATVIATLLAVIVIQSITIAALATTQTSSRTAYSSGSERVPHHRSAVRDDLRIRVSPRPVSRGTPRPPLTMESTSQPVPNLEARDVLEVTAYCWTGNRTASGVWPDRGMAAGNDWTFGTRLRVEGVGVVTVTDRYGYGTQLDIFLGHYDGCEHDALVFGRRHLHVEVVP